MNIIMSKLIRDVVMHWIYIKVWFTTKPFLYLLKIGHGALVCNERTSTSFSTRGCANAQDKPLSTSLPSVS